jgi:Abnormal spindle-like microcephaly-assoc'd, ASPM-SPD-2-Hydin
LSYHCLGDDAPLNSSHLDRYHEEWIAVNNCKHRAGGYLLLLGLTISLFVGCGGGTGTTTKSATGGSAQLAVSPSSMNFGSVLVGESKALPGTLTATNASVTVSSAAWSGEGYSVSGISFPVVLPAGQPIPFTVTFAPQTAGNSPGSINFVSSASNSPGSQVLSGNGTQLSTHSVNLWWDPSTSQVMGYNVYRGTKNGGPYSRLTSTPQPSTSYDDVTVQSGLTYFYVTTAVDADWKESSYSNQTAAAIP